MKQKLFAMLAKLFLGGLFRDIAEGKGKLGRLKPLYWKVAGWKRITGAIVGLAWAALMYFQPQTASKIEEPVLLVAGLLVSWGFVDAAWRNGKPLPEWSETFAKICSAGPALAAIVALVAEYLPRIPGCTACGAWSIKLQLFAAAVATATGWLAARFATPPAITE